MAYCSKCGAKLKDNAKFCPSCGEKLTEDVQAEVLDDQEQPPKTEESETAQVAETKTQAEEASEPAAPKHEEKSFNPKKVTLPSTDSLNQLMKSFKDGSFFKKYQKQVAAAAVVVVLLIGAYWFLHRPQDISKDVKVTFSGYDTQGTADYNAEAVSREIFKLAYKKAGVSKDDIEGLISGNDAVMNKYDTDQKLYTEASEGDRIASNVEVTLNAGDKLKNGEKIELSIVDHNAKGDRIIKNVDKKVKVESLKKVKTYTVKDLLTKEKYSFAGLNGGGMITFAKDDSYSDFDEIDDDGALSNGDKVKVQVSQDKVDSLKEKGQFLDGDDSYTLKVSGLKDAAAIGRVDECLTQLDTAVKADYINSDFDTYTIKRVASYISPYMTYDDETGGDRGTSIDIEGFYQIDHVSSFGDDTQKDTTFISYGFHDASYDVEKNEIDVEDHDSGDTYGDNYDGDSLDDALITYKADYPNTEALK